MHPDRRLGRPGPGREDLRRGARPARRPGGRARRGRWPAGPAGRPDARPRSWASPAPAGCSAGARADEAVAVPAERGHRRRVQPGQGAAEALVGGRGARTRGDPRQHEHVVADRHDLGHRHPVDLAEPAQPLGLDAEQTVGEAGRRLGEQRAPVGEVDVAGHADRSPADRRDPDDRQAQHVGDGPGQRGRGTARHATPGARRWSINPSQARPAGRTRRRSRRARRSTGRAPRRRSASGPKAVMRCTLARAGSSGADRSRARSTVASATSSRSKRSQSSGRTCRARCGRRSRPRRSASATARRSGRSPACSALVPALSISMCPARPAALDGAAHDAPRRWATGRCSPSTRTARGSARRAGGEGRQTRPTSVPAARGRRTGVRAGPARALRCDPPGPTRGSLPGGATHR